ncbi:N6-adenosine-methyltransferase non-catalytic subunit MTB-like [Pecten maximus]|uniref:N6-adenosine-methyltransferase non-catalytic subunit MTB-like n=1 Tax=Pecten maximus TaxID=6579 RepID=UPI001458933A|nr:N6-adenosine-methyltransferase non-catalytic subunit MTB-like [Pecten maximus]XP_033746042.1 N6-adenosine-methyltransferase non-catalytic subunit MTB-like [Pecten maximus]
MWTTPIWVLLFAPLLVTAQWANWQNQNPQNTKESYYLDSNTDCNNKFDIGENSAFVNGLGATLENSPPKSCQITFSTDYVREKRKFRVEVITANFNEDGVNFYIYDSSTTDSLLYGFGFRRDKPANFQPLFTSGGFVTFKLDKADKSQANYNIRVHVISVPGDVSIVDECPGGEGPGCNYYFYQSPITKEIIIGIVGGVFGLILFVIAPIIIICCYRKSKGVNRRWDEFKLGQASTAANISNSKGSVRATSHDTKSKLWASQSSKMGLTSINKSSRSRGRLSEEEEDSVFDDGPPRNYPPPPPPYERYDKSSRRNRDDYDGRNRRYDRYDSRDEEYDRKDRHRDRNDDRFDRQPRREMDRKRRNSPRRSYYSDSNSEMESSFVQAEDDHPQERFVERIIEPRVKPKAKKTVVEDVYDELSEDIEEIRNSSVQCGPSDDENESNTETTDDETTETESDSDSEKKKKDPRAALYSKPNKKGKVKTVAAKPSQPNVALSQPGPVMAGPTTGYPMVGQPMIGQPMIGQPHTMARPPVPGIIPGVIVRPATQPQFAPGQYPPVVRPGVPIQPGQMQFRPVQPPNYPTVRMPHQQVPQKSQPTHPRMASNPPPDPPMYSYLVQRGYTGRYSPVSSGTGVSSDAHMINLTDDSEGGSNLPSGVDLMKRTTDV